VGKSQPEYGQGLSIDFNMFRHIPTEDLSPFHKNDSHNIDVSLFLDDDRCYSMSVMFYDNLCAPPGVYADVVDEGTRIAIAALNVMPLLCGTVTLESKDLMHDPVCDLRFMSTETDRFIVRRVVRENLKLVTTSPLWEEVACEVPPVGFNALVADSSDADIDERIVRMAATMVHPMGTCALGKALDGDFKVKGVEGLRVCDAGVFPKPLAGMLSYMIYALAELCVEIVVRKTQWLLWAEFEIILAKSKSTHDLNRDSLFVLHCLHFIEVVWQDSCTKMSCI
jgi:hypothetical protein